MRYILDSGGRPTHSVPYVRADKYALAGRVSQGFVYRGVEPTQRTRLQGQLASQPFPLWLHDETTIPHV